VRVWSSSDVAAIRTVLAEALASDPLLRWMFPDEEHRVEATAAWLGLFAERYAQSGQIDVIEMDELVAVALWRMPDDQPASSPPTLPTIQGLLGAIVGTARAGAVRNGLAAIATVTPPGRYAYLNLLAVRPSVQRQGLGRRVLEPGFAASDTAGLGVHLETTNPANLAFYRSLGFDVTGETDLGAGGPRLWAMWRPLAG
jgi:ribosomal protein S18 acetylase RimI-like enzyme